MRHRGTRQGRAFASLVLAGMLGCQLTPAPALVECPLPMQQQAEEILKIVPLGTPRAEALKKLKEAGIRGNFGENESIFYCDFWHRDEHVRWHINVMLLFDEEGKLYATRPEANVAADASSAPPSPPDDPFQ
jgi:hypothetical protein